MGLKIFACGDIVNTTAKKDFIDEALSKVIKSCDIAIGNFEAPICVDEYNKISKIGPSLCQPRESVEIMRQAGFTYLSLANNHIYDYGKAGLRETISELKKYDIGFIGAGTTFEDAYHVCIIERKGIKIGLVAAGENGFGCLDEKMSDGGGGGDMHGYFTALLKTPL
jgi:poly-gamma-glutamate synthesis protein (capsule biosynthesis protein)